MVRLARLIVRVFFRQLQVEHGDRLRPGGPTVLVADHRNGLVDGLVLMAVLDRFPRFLGKSTLFGNPLLWPLLKLAGVVPVYRTQDGGSVDRNADTFAAAERLLARGGLVAIFPEGISHDEPGVQPLRTGAARIALGAVAHGVDGVETVAVSLVYDDKQRFRSRALVRVGLPRPVGGGSGSTGQDRLAVRQLTDELATQLRGMGPDTVDPVEADLITEVADVVARTDEGSCVPVDLARRQQAREWLIGDGAPPGPTGPSGVPVDRLWAAADSYRRARIRADLTDAQVAATEATPGSRWRLLPTMTGVALLSPLAVLGTLIHVVPYVVVRHTGRIPRNQSIRATVKILGDLVLFALLYLVLGVIAGAAFGGAAGVVVALGAPVCGFVAVVTAERLHRLRDQLVVDRWVRRRPNQVAELVALRNDVLASVRARPAPFRAVPGP